MPAFTTHLVSPWGGNINQKMPPIGETEARDDVEFDEYYICNAEGISFAETGGRGGGWGKEWLGANRRGFSSLDYM